MVRRTHSLLETVGTQIIVLALATLVSVTDEVILFATSTRYTDVDVSVCDKQALNNGLYTCCFILMVVVRGT